MGKTSWRLGLTVLIILLLIGGGAGIYWYLQQSNSSAQNGGTQAISIYPDVIPASTASFKAYDNINAGYHFTISYPVDWSMDTSIDNSALTMSFDYQVLAGPDDYPLEIDCDANPQGLSAQQWSEAQPQLTSQGSQKLSSGVETFVATGAGEGAYTAYSVTHGQQACTLYAFQASPENTKLIVKAINTFTWNA